MLDVQAVRRTVVRMTPFDNTDATTPDPLLCRLEAILRAADPAAREAFMAAVAAFGDEGRRIEGVEPSCIVRLVVHRSSSKSL